MNVRLTHNPLFALATLALSASLAVSQQTPPAPAATAAAPAAAPAPVVRQAPQNPGMRQGMRPGMMPGGGMQPGAGPGMSDGMMQRHRAQMMGGHGGFDGSGFHIAPGGMWWKNPRVVQTLTLTPDQTAKMDGIFQQSRLDLIDKKASVEKAQVMLEPMLSANPIDTAKAMAQIDKIAEARADLEKANARMLLGIRAVLTPDQWTKLRAHDFGGPGVSGGPGGPGGGPSRGRGPRPGGAAGGMDELVDPIDQP